MLTTDHVAPGDIGTGTVLVDAEGFAWQVQPDGRATGAMDGVHFHVDSITSLIKKRGVLEIVWTPAVRTSDESMDLLTSSLARPRYRTGEDNRPVSPTYLDDYRRRQARALSAEQCDRLLATTPPKDAS